jgi:hypothetical protein
MSHRSLVTLHSIDDLRQRFSPGVARVDIRPTCHAYSPPVTPDWAAIESAPEIAPISRARRQFGESKADRYCHTPWPIAPSQYRRIQSWRRVSLQALRAKVDVRHSSLRNFRPMEDAFRGEFPQREFTQPDSGRMLAFRVPERCIFEMSYIE